MLDRLKRVPGTTNVQIFGAKDYAMRIWLKPDRLTQLSLTTGDVARAIQEQNAQFAPGKVGQPPVGNGQQLVYTITTQGRFSEPEQFENIVVRANPDGSLVRLKDVADVQLGSKDYEFIGRVNGENAVLVGIFLQPGANALAVADEVNGADGRTRHALPGRHRARRRVRHHALRRSLHPRSGEDARRGHAAGVRRGVPVPAELARDADPDASPCRCR